VTLNPNTRLLSDHTVHRRCRTRPLMKNVFKLSLFALALALAPFTTEARASEAIAVTTRGASAEAERHKTTVEERMTDYFQYEYVGGLNRGIVISAKASVIETLPVQGWPHRFRSSGKAYVEYYDAARRTSGRITREFEVVTEEKDSGAIKVESLKVT
jgi:hypothetical protein